MADVAHRPVRRPARGDDRPRRRAASLPQQGRVLVRRRRGGRAGPGLPPPRRWDQIDDVEQDILASERVDELRRAVRAWAATEGLTAYDRREHTGLLRNLVVREGRRTGALRRGWSRALEPFEWTTSPRPCRWTACSGPRAAGGDHPRGRDRGHPRRRGDRGGALGPPLPHLAGRLLPDQHRDGRAPLREGGRSGRPQRASRCSTSTAASARSGWCWPSTHARSTAWRSWSARWRTRSTTPASTASTTRTSSPATSAPRCGRSSAFGGPTWSWWTRRAGLSQKIVRRVLEAEARRIVYVSCNPTTLAPNARQMADAGYELKTVRPVDMFPHTPHIESVALLERAG